MYTCLENKTKLLTSLARECKKLFEHGVTTTLQVPPMFVQETLDANMLGTSFVRLVRNNVLNLSSRDVAENTNLLSPASAGVTTLH